MGSMGILIAITCIANYISGMILAREKYDTLKMIVYIVVQVLLSYLLIDKVPRIIVYTGIIGTVYLLYDKSKSFDYSLVIALFVQIIIMIADVIESNLAILITKKDINTLLYRNDYNMIIYAFIAILILSLLSAFVSWVVNKKMKMKMLDFKEINMGIIDLIRIVGILFDNAIQAAEATESGKVTCTLKQGDIFKIEIRNNYIGNIDDTSKFFEKGYTTKESGSGIGLYNFLNIIHNYDNAIYSVTLDNNEFIIRITIS